MSGIQPIVYDMSDDDDVEDNDMTGLTGDRDDDDPVVQRIPAALLVAKDQAEVDAFIAALPARIVVPEPDSPPAVHTAYHPEWTTPGATTDYEPYYRPALLPEDDALNPTPFAR